MESLLTVVMNMNRNRLLARLRSTHARTSRRSDRTATVRRLQDMVENLRSTASQGFAQSRIANLRSTTHEIGQAFTLLEASNTEAVLAGERDGLITRLLYLLGKLPSAKDLTDILTSFALRRDNRFQGRDDLVNTFTKLRKYRASCEFLSKAASASAIFRNITVAEVSVQHSLTLNTRGNTHSLAACFKRLNVTWDREMSKRLNATLPHLSDRFQKEMANFKPKIHAEIQLVFFYEQYTNLQQPRVICSSKSACFLCSLFIRLHGKFWVRRTHGVLYPKWTLPAVSDVSLSRDTKQTMNRLLDDFRIEIQREIGKRLRLTQPKRMHPTESLFSLQMWFDSNTSLIGPYAVGPDKVVQTVSGVLPQEVIHSDQFTDNNDAKADATKSMPPSTVDASLKLTTNDDTGMRRQTIGGQASSQTFASSVNSNHEYGISQSSILGQQKLTEDRLQIDLDCGEQCSAAQSMRDHGSRSCDALVAYDASELRQVEDFNTSCATSTCRRIDFHELELFVETELPVSIETTEIYRPTIRSIDASTIVRIDKLAAGQEIAVESYQSMDNKRTIILNMQGWQGEDRWWRMSWVRK